MNTESMPAFSAPANRQVLITTEQHASGGVIGCQWRVWGCTSDVVFKAVPNGNASPSWQQSCRCLINDRIGLAHQEHLHRKRSGLTCS